MGYWPVVNHILEEADIVVVVADARMPLESVNSELIGKLESKNKEYVIAYNKSDLVSEKILSGLRKRHKGTFFVSGIKNRGIKELRKYLQILAKRMKLDYPKVAVVGYPNIGKSAVINALARRARTLVADMPGTTKGTQWILVSNLKIFDSPGVVPFGEKNVKLGMLGAKSPDKMDDPYKVALEILHLFLGNDIHILERHYDIKIESKEEDLDFLIEKIAKKKGYLKKGGEIDERRTVVSIIRDWQKGKLKLV